MRLLFSILQRVFREVKRVLRDDGVLWLNLGDSYAGSLILSGNFDLLFGSVQSLGKVS